MKCVHVECVFVCLFVFCMYVCLYVHLYVYCGRFYLGMSCEW